MRKFVIVNESKAERVVCCECPSAIEIKEHETLIEVDVNKKIRKGEMFSVASKVAKAEVKKSYWKIAAIVSAVAAAGGAAYYFTGGF